MIESYILACTGGMCYARHMDVADDRVIGIETGDDGPATLYRAVGRDYIGPWHSSRVAATRDAHALAVAISQGVWRESLCPPTPTPHPPGARAGHREERAMETATFRGVGLADAGPVEFTVTGVLRGHWLWVEEEAGGYWIDTGLPGYERIA